MANESTGAAASTKTLSEAATAAAEVLKQLAAALPGGEGEADGESPITNEALEQVRWARKKYDAVVKWILGAFAAIGLILFGSLPFVQLSNVELLPVVLGLGAAALGLGLIIWGASRAFEPEDASLGELDELVTRVQKFKTRRRGLHKVRWWISPRWRASTDLYEILMKEPETHIGPGMGSVRDLITEIGEVERQILILQSGNAATASLQTILDELSRAAHAVPSEPEPAPAPPDDTEQSLRRHRKERRGAIGAYTIAVKARLLDVLNTRFGANLTAEEAWASLPTLPANTLLDNVDHQMAAASEAAKRALQRATGIAVALDHAPIRTSDAFSPELKSDLQEARRSSNSSRPASSPSGMIPRRTPSR